MQNNNNAELPTSKRRKKNIPGWKQSVLKTKRNSGVGYTTSQNKEVVDKTEPVEATCKCQFACHSVTLAYRRRLFVEFWKIGEYNGQQNFLRACIRPSLIKRRRHGNYETPEDSKRQHSFRYLLQLPGAFEVQVCKKTFCETFDVTQRRVQLLAEKILTGKLDIKDERGGTRPKKNSGWKDKIQEYISLIPARESHYSRKDNPDRKFLSPDLNVSKLYRGFLERYTEDGRTPPVSRQWFNDVFLSDFNLSFALPRVDTCSVCDSKNIEIKGKEGQEKVDAQNSLEIHQRKAELAQRNMADDSRRSKMPDSNVCVLSFDLQQQMYVPSLTHTEMYYSRQLACINMGIHLEDLNKGFMCLWNETLGGRGSNEIASCLYNFIMKELQTQKRELILWSDNCCGQNKNQIMLAMQLTLIAKAKFDRITHKFPVSGHTFLSCDRDFALIEKLKRRLSPKVPRDLIEIMASACLKNPFVIMDVTTFFDWKSIAQKYLDTKKLTISKVTEMRMSRRKFGVVEIRTSYSELAPWTQINVLKKTASIELFQSLPIQFKETPKPLSAEKKKDLTAVLRYLAGPDREYYQGIISQ